MPDDVASIKAELKLYGPMCMDICANDICQKTVATGGCDHAVVVSGWVDDPTWAGGGYWIVKNSWGTAPNNGYYYLASATRPDFPTASKR